MDLSNENIVHVKKDGIEYLQFRKLLEFDNLVHCYTLSTNNIDFRRSFRSSETVDKSIDRLCEGLDIDKNTIIRPGQTHTDVVKRVESADTEFNDVDGLLTDKANINMVLSFADCTPIFIYDPVKKVAGNIHSGWRGTAQKIGQKAILKMIEDFGCKAEDLIVCLGPCIGKYHFEVGEDVKDIFRETFGYLNRDFDIIEKEEEVENKYFIDTTLINRLILQEVGVKEENIVESGICTACNSEIMHSHRIDGDLSGRNVSVMGLKEGEKYV